MNKNILFVFFLLSFLSNFIYAQKDSLILKNGDVIVGEVKGMNRGVVTLETDYSDKDFKIEWSGLKKIYTNTIFLITTSEGTRYNGRLLSGLGDDIYILSISGLKLPVTRQDVVLLQSVSQGFWSRLKAAIDFGYSVARANNLHQVTLGSTMSYIGDKWSGNMMFNGLSSVQDDVDPIKRWEGDLTYRYYFPKDWYLFSQISFLSNTEQKLDLRSMGKLGAGNFIIHTNVSYWGLLGGFSFNNEKYSTELTNDQSLEGFAGTELNLYDIGDLNLLVNLTAYPNLTDVGRWRADFNFETKYDLPLDFYIKIGFSLNYDNRPVEGAVATDYVLTTGFGWEFDH
jgi:hypothetical protein